jgi:CO/xanthine dehydrogenase Mo-binding subunit
MAVIEAARDVIGTLKARAAALWKCDPDMVDWQDGQAVPKPGQNLDVQPLSLAEIAAMRRQDRRADLSAGRRSRPAVRPRASVSASRRATSIRKRAGRTCCASRASRTRARRSIRPTWRGSSRAVPCRASAGRSTRSTSTTSEGRQQNPGFLDYRIPVASDVPMIDTVIVEVPNPRHPYGVRGVGETPIVGPLAAVGNAVNAATGLELHDLPLAPHKVLAALQARG